MKTRALTFAATAVALAAFGTACGGSLTEPTAQDAATTDDGTNHSQTATPVARKVDPRRNRDRG